MLYSIELHCLAVHSYAILDRVSCCTHHSSLALSSAAVIAGEGASLYTLNTVANDVAAEDRDGELCNQHGHAEDQDEELCNQPGHAEDRAEERRMRN